MTPFPGTELYDNIEQYGTMSMDTDDYTFEGGAFVPYTMTREQIEELRTLAFRKFYSRPKFIARRLLEVRSLYDLKTVLKGATSFFWLWAKHDSLVVRKKSGPATESATPASQASEHSDESKRAS